MDLPASCHPDTIAMYRYWLEKCGKRAMPARADIDPIEMAKRLLRGICLIDVMTGERRYSVGIVQQKPHGL